MSTSIPDLFREVCEKNDWTWQGTHIEVLLPKGRKQVLSIDRFDHEGTHCIRAWTVIGNAKALSEGRVLAAMRINAGLPWGALAIHEDDLVLTDTFVVERLGFEDVQSSLRFLAATADRYESLLYGTDEH